MSLFEQLPEEIKLMILEAIATREPARLVDIIFVSKDLWYTFKSCYAQISGKYLEANASSHASIRNSLVIASLPTRTRGSISTDDIESAFYKVRDRKNTPLSKDVYLRAIRFNHIISNQARSCHDQWRNGDNKDVYTDEEWIQGAFLHTFNFLAFGGSDCEDRERQTDLFPRPPVKEADSTSTDKDDEIDDLLEVLMEDPAFSWKAVDAAEYEISLILWGHLDQVYRDGFCLCDRSTSGSELFDQPTMDWMTIEKIHLRTNSTEGVDELEKWVKKNKEHIITKGEQLIPHRRGSDLCQMGVTEGSVGAISLTGVAMRSSESTDNIPISGPSKSDGKHCSLLES